MNNSPTELDDREEGLYEKYEVYEDGEEVDSCFVLEPETDSAARRAIYEYAKATDDEKLASELRGWMLAVEEEGSGEATGQREGPPELGDVMDFPDEPRTDDRRWIVLFEEDYDNVAIDPHGNVGVLVDIEQTGELFQLAAQTLSSLSHRDAEPDEPIRDLIEALEEVLDDE